MAEAEPIRRDYASFLIKDDSETLRRTRAALDLDTQALLLVQRAEEGIRVFQEQLKAYEHMVRHD